MPSVQILIVVRKDCKAGVGEPADEMLFARLVVFAVEQLELAGLGVQHAEAPS